MLKRLNPLLHSQLRLAVMSILLSVDEADFVYLKEKTGATSGNLSVQIDINYRQPIYIRVRKEFVGKKTRDIVPNNRKREGKLRSLCKYFERVS